MRFPVPQPILGVLSRLEACGFAAYLVGGCIRDDMLGIQPKEYDVASAARPEEVQACFQGERLLETGLKHGTLTLLTDAGPCEITTFRSDGTYSDNRHPDSVRFSLSIEEDLQRRDFTVNAMAYSPTRGLVDPFMGRLDCARKVLRAVGDPLERFREDALRILRGLRFAATLGFDIDADSYQAMLAMLPGLARISRERIGHELNRMLLGAHAADTLGLYPRLLFSVLPELQPILHHPQRSRFHIYDVWEHSLETLRLAPAELALRWAALFHDSGKPETSQVDPDGSTHFRGHPAISMRIAKDSLASLKQPKKLMEEVGTLVLYHDDRVGQHNLQLWLARLGFPLLRQLILLQAADLEAHAPHVHHRAQEARQLIEAAQALLDSGACLSIKDLKINGHDLRALGYPDGPLMGETLQYMLDMVLTGRAPNEADYLHRLASLRLRRHRFNHLS